MFTIHTKNVPLKDAHIEFRTETAEGVKFHFPTNGLTLVGKFDLLPEYTVGEPILLDAIGGRVNGPVRDYSQSVDWTWDIATNTVVPAAPRTFAKDWSPMPPSEGPPLPAFFGIYWPWYKR